jgi:hypothetical protein
MGFERAGANELSVEKCERAQHFELPRTSLSETRSHPPQPKISQPPLCGLRNFLVGAGFERAGDRVLNGSVFWWHHGFFIEAKKITSLSKRVPQIKNKLALTD